MRNTVVECDVSGAEPCVQILGIVNHATLMLPAVAVAMLVPLNYQCVSVRPCEQLDYRSNYIRAILYSHTVPRSVY